MTIPYEANLPSDDRFNIPDYTILLRLRFDVRLRQSAFEQRIQDAKALRSEYLLEVSSAMTSLH